MRRKLYAITKLLWFNALVFAALIGFQEKATAQASYDSSHTFQIVDSLFAGQTDAKILQVVVYVSGGTDTVWAEKFDFNTTGTGNASDINEARLYYLGGSANTTNPLDLSDTVASKVMGPSGNFSFTDSIPLTSGRHHFILTYDLEWDVEELDSFDAQFTGITIDGTSQTPNTTNPNGDRVVAEYGADLYCSFGRRIAGSYQIGAQNIQIGDVIDNYSDNTLVYTFYNEIYAPLRKNTTYSLSYKAGPLNDEQVRIWVDWDGDGYFENDEVAFSAGYVDNGTRTNGNITVPCDIKPGQKRMRILADFFPYQPSACGTLTYGTGEDYIITVLPESELTASFEPDSNAYTNALLQMENTSVVNSSRVRYEWDVDDDGSYDSTVLNLATRYSSSGKKPITLRATVTSCDGNNTFSDTYTDTVDVQNTTKAPVVDFVANKNVVQVGEDITINDLTENGAASYQWVIVPDINMNGDTTFEFINNTNANSKNPQIHFLQEGVFTAALTATNSIGSDKTVKVNYFSVGGSFIMCESSSTTRDTVVDNFGVIYDDGGADDVYGTNLDCGLLIQPECAKEVHLDLDFIDITPFTQTGSTGDFLRIYDGVDVKGDELHTTLGYPSAGIQSPTSGPVSLGRVTAESGQMFIRFIADGSSVSDGFRMRWSITNKNVSTPNASVSGPDTVYINSPATYTSSVKDNKVLNIWEFDGDGLPDRTGKRASYSWSTAGTYTINLVLDACGSLDTVNKQVVVITPSSAPVADFEANFTILAPSDTLFLEDRSTEGPTSFTWTFDRPGAINYVNNTNANSVSPAVMFDSLGLYTITYEVENSLGSDDTTKTDYILVRDYCTPSIITGQSDNGISAVTLMDINGNVLFTNETDLNEGYNNYSGKYKTTMDQGARYIIKVERDFALNNMKRVFWIDYDLDGIFNDSNEVIASQGNSRTLSWTDTFVVSTNSTLGFTRLRVATNAANQTNYGCGPHFSGEFEDYGVILRPDQTPPAIMLTGGDSIEVEQCATYADPGYAAEDNVDGTLTSSVAVSGTVNTAVTGDYTITYRVTDAAGNRGVAKRIVTVFPDSTAPVVTVNGNIVDTITVFTSHTDMGVSTSDPCAGVASVTSNSDLDTAVVGTYTISYTVTDNEGNVTVVDRTVMVVDDVAPTFTFQNNSDTMYVEVLTTYNEEQWVAADNYDANPSVIINGSVNTSRIDTYYVNYSVNDVAGNGPVTATRVVIVQDTEAPELTLLYDTLSVRVFRTLNLPQPNVRDNFTRRPTLNMIGNYNKDEIGDYEIQYYAVDGSGNHSDTVSLIVRVYDDIAPVIQLRGGPITRLCRWADTVEFGFTVSDNYNDSTELTYTIDDGGFTTQSVDIYTVSYTATDESGNSSTVTRSYVVEHCNVGIDENLADRYMTLYPNPAVDQTQLVVDLPEQSMVQIELTDMVGRTVKVLRSGMLQTDLIQVNVADLEGGVYYINLKVDGTIYTKKLVVNK